MTVEKSPVWYGVIVTLGVLVVALLSKWSGSGTPRYAPKFARDVKALVKESARWSAVAEQDTNLMLRVLHSTYALAYLNAARTLQPDKDLERLSSVKVDEMHAQQQAAQQAALQKVAAAHPTIMPEGANVLYTGWLST
jgi:hypothetical protein